MKRKENKTRWNVVEKMRGRRMTEEERLRALAELNS